MRALGFCVSVDRARYMAQCFTDAGIPALAVSAETSGDERRAALAALRNRGINGIFEGVLWRPELNTDAFLITLKNSETDYSPTTMYRDFALSDRLFRWESQSRTSVASPAGQRYINHREHGSHILLFVRAAKTTALGEGGPMCSSVRQTMSRTKERSRW